jgi:hypothetical protein
VVQVAVAPTSRSFALGERISFTEEDFSEIAQTFVCYANQVNGAIVALQRDRFEAQAEIQGGIPTEAAEDDGGPADEMRGFEGSWGRA